MSRASIERRLFDLAQRMVRAREELAVIDEQLAALNDAADDARIRALVSETPMAEREHADAQRHADAMARSRTTVVTSITEMQDAQNELLDRLVGEPGR